MTSRGTVPPVTTTITLPPPDASAFNFALLNPTPLAANVRPSSAFHRERRQQKSVFVAVVGDSLANNQAGIADRLRDSQDAEITLRKIAKCVEVKDLAIGVKESVLGVVIRGRGSDDHSGCIGAGAGDPVGCARCSTERSQVGHAEGKIGPRASARDEKEHRCETGFVLRSNNSDGSSNPTYPKSPLQASLGLWLWFGIVKSFFMSEGGEVLSFKS
jgi:hypothetical protein